MTDTLKQWESLSKSPSLTSLYLILYTPYYGICTSPLHMYISSQSLFPHLIHAMEVTSTLSLISSFIILLLLVCPHIYLNIPIFVHMYLLKLGVLDWPTLHPIQQSRSNHHFIKLTLSSGGTSLSHKMLAAGLHFIHVAPIQYIRSLSISLFHGSETPNT